MTAELEFHAGGATVDVVEAAWTEVLGELATPGAPVHDECDTRELDPALTGPRPVEAEVTTRHHSTGTAILVTLGTNIVWWELEGLWRDVVRPRLMARSGVEPGEVVSSRGPVPATTDWPSHDDPMEVALAARVALLSASGLHPDDKPSPEQDQLASFIMWATDVGLVDGRGFGEFLEDAQRRIADDVGRHANVRTALPDAAAALQDARPIDVVAELYGKLAQFAAAEYARPELARLPLERFVVDPGTRPERVSAAVPDSRSKVMLTLDTGFDLFALALLPRVLVHELVGHAGAGHPTNGPHSTTQLFEEGFMDVTSEVLLLRWLEDTALHDLAPAGHVSAGLVHRYHTRLYALRAGRDAWTACRIAVGRDLARRPGAPRTAEATTAQATLQLNATGDDIRDKDEFVDLARRGRARTLARFVGLTREEIAAEDVVA